MNNKNMKYLGMVTIENTNTQNSRYKISRIMYESNKTTATNHIYIQNYGNNVYIRGVVSRC
jgi:phosphosulfolactate synthase (CoM biosynthesis protein A)